MLPSKADLCIFPLFFLLRIRLRFKYFRQNFCLENCHFLPKKDSGPNTCFFSCLSHIRIFFFKSNHP